MKLRTRRACWGFLGVVAACSPTTKPADAAKVEAVAKAAAEPAKAAAEPVKAAAEPVSEPAVKAAAGPVLLPGFTPQAGTVAVTSSHACALAGEGQVWCWGDGREGEVVPEVAEKRFLPVQVAGVERAIAVAVDDYLSCALTADGAVHCWGRFGKTPRRRVTIAAGVLGHAVEFVVSAGPFLGELPPWVCARRGDGTIACKALTGSATDVVVVEGVREAVALAGIDGVVAALQADGSVVEFKPLVAGSDRATPVPGLDDVEEIGGGHYNVCARTKAGPSRCRSAGSGWVVYPGLRAPLWKRWMSPEQAATAVDGAESIRLKCVRDGAGQLACWGDNESGQLALGEPSFSTAPRRVLTGAQLVAGGDRTCAVQADQTVTCFDHQAGKVEVEGVRSLALGMFHACAIVGAGEARCWGVNEYGALGLPEVLDDTAPKDPNRLAEHDGEELVRVPGLSDLVHVAVGESHSCAARRDGQLRCWGLGEAGQLGDGKSDDPDEVLDTPHASAKQVVVPGISGELRGLALAGATSCAWTDAGLWCWGHMTNPSTTADARISRPRKLLSGKIVDVDGDDTSLCALDEAGAVFCLGEAAEAYHGGEFVKYVERGEKADPNQFPGGGPLWPMRGLAFAAKAMVAGYGFACVQSEAGEVWCWGDNEEGTLGDGTTRDSEEPVKVVGLPGPPVQLAAGRSHVCARMADGAIFCWGAKTSPLEFAESKAPRAVEGLAPYVVTTAVQ